MTDPSAMPFGMTTNFPARLVGLSGKLLPGLRQKNSLPTGFHLEIEPVVLGEISQAIAIYAGKFEFADEIITSTPHEVFTLGEGQPQWRSALMCLAWLKHLNASKRSLHDQHAMRLLHYWSKAKKPKLSISQHLEIISALATHGQHIAKRCEILLQKDFLRIVSDELKGLLRLKPRSAEDSVLKALAQFYCLVAFQNFGFSHAAAQTLFEQNIDKIILPDGGYILRDVQKLIRFLEFALPLHRIQSPIAAASLSNAVSRGMVHLKLLQGQDGKVSNVISQNKQTIDPSLLFAFYGVEITMPELASDSGFARLDQANSTIMANTDPTLVIEFFGGGEKLFDTAPQRNGHSFPAQLHSAAQGKALLIASSHMKRTCFLSADGNDLRVEDEMISAGENQTVLQISPTIQLSTLMEGQIIMLILPDKTVWHLRQRGGKIQIRQTSAQNEIVIDHLNGSINWSVKKQASTVKPSRKKQTTDAQLLI